MPGFAVSRDRWSLGLFLGFVLVLGLASPQAALAQNPDTIGLFRSGSPSGSNTFYLLNLNALVAPVNVIWGFGIAGDVAVVGDWNFRPQYAKPLADRYPYHQPRRLRDLRHKPAGHQSG